MEHENVSLGFKNLPAGMRSKQSTAIRKSIEDGRADVIVEGDCVTEKRAGVSPTKLHEETLAGPSGESSSGHEVIVLEETEEDEQGTSDVINEDPRSHLAASNKNPGSRASELQSFVTFYFCQICQYFNQSRRAVEAHMNIHAGEKQVCDFCELECSQPGELMTHVMKHIGNRPYACDICDASFLVVPDLVKHETEHGVPYYSCGRCQFKCRRPSVLEEHEKTHLSEEYACCICDHRCRGLASLEEHTFSHLGEKPYLCDVCDYRCSEAGDLKKHKRTHSLSAKKPYACDLCDFTSRNYDGLRTHGRTHTGEKPFACDVCEYRSACASSLKTHVRRHTGERPYPCNYCNLKFAAGGIRAKHEKRKHRNVLAVEKND